MFIGHFAVGFAGKRVAPQSSLVTLLLAPLFLDLLWPILVLAGVERVAIDLGNTPFTPLAFTHYPYSHSLLFTLIWAALFAWVAWVRTGSVRLATWLAAAVASHWLFDFFTHRPDLPLYPGGPLVGLGLWYSKTWTVIVEGALLAAGLGMYLATTRARGRMGSVALGSFVAFLLVGYWGAVQGAVPPSARAVAVVDLVATPVCLVWAWWVDRTRELRSQAPPTA